MTVRPLFSILIPTKNRAGLLRFALESMRRQTFGDYEVVISDDHSTDNTVQIVADFGDNRFRLVHPPTPLNMADHYEFVASQAKGEYINFLPDRSVFYSFALEKIAQVIEKTKHPLIGWNNDRHNDVSADRRMFHQHRRSGKLVEYPSEYLLRLHYDQNLPEVNFSVASPASSTCHRALVEKIRSRGRGRLIYPIVPDITYSVSALAMTPIFLYIDQSLSVGAGYLASVGHSMTQRREAAFRRLVGSTGEFCQRVPCKGVLVNSNLVADDLLMLKEMYPKELDNYDLNYQRYFEKVLKEIFRLEAVGADASSDEWKAFKKGLRQMPLALQSYILRRIWTHRFRQQARRARRQVRKILPEKAVSFVRSIKPAVSLGENSTSDIERVTCLGAATVLEAIAWAEAQPFDDQAINVGDQRVNLKSQV